MYQICETDPSILDWLINFLTRCSTYGFNLVDFPLNILVDFHISFEILSGWLIWLTSFILSSWLSYQPGDTFGWLVWLTFLLTFWLTSISALKYLLVDLFGWLLLYIQVDFHISQETLSVDLFGWLSFIHSCWLSYQSFGWLLGWLCSLHFGWLSYQPWNTFQLTY